MKCCDFIIITKLNHISHKIRGVRNKLIMEFTNISDSDKVWNSLHELPDDILKKIYYDNFHIKHKCDELLKWWNDNSRLNCSPNDVEELTNKILENNEGVEYLKQHNNHFEHVYKEHFIYNLHPERGGFKLMNKTQSLITSVSFYMWH